MNSIFYSKTLLILFCCLSLPYSTFANEYIPQLEAGSFFSGQFNSNHRPNIQSSNDTANEFNRSIITTTTILKDQIRNYSDSMLSDEINRWVKVQIIQNGYLPGLRPDLPVRSSMDLVYSFIHSPKDKKSHLVAVLGNVETPLMASQLAYRLIKSGNIEKAEKILSIWVRNIGPSILLRELKNRLEINKDRFGSLCARSLTH